MPRRLRRFARVFLVAVPSFIAGAVFTAYLAADASRLFFQMLRTDYGAEEEIAAVFARHRGDVHEAAWHYANVVSTYGTGTWWRTTSTKDGWRLAFPLGDPLAGRGHRRWSTKGRGYVPCPPVERPHGGLAGGGGHAGVGSRGAAARTERRIEGRSTPREPSPRRRQPPPDVLPIFVKQLRGQPRLQRRLSTSPEIRGCGPPRPRRRGGVQALRGACRCTMCRHLHLPGGVEDGTASRWEEAHQESSRAA